VRGCDRSPVDIADESELLRLHSYVWPEQRLRVERLKLAIPLAQQHRVHVDKADAADWTELNVKLKHGSVTVLYHTVVWQYLPVTTRQRITNHMHTIGQNSSADAPLAWLRTEPVTVNSHFHFAVKLTLWPGGTERIIAECHSHGTWIDMKVDGKLV